MQTPPERDYKVPEELGDINYMANGCMKIIALVTACIIAVIMTIAYCF